MANTLPSYINVSNSHGGNSTTNALVSTGLTLRGGDLLLALVHEDDATTGNTWAVNAPWQIIANVNTTTHAMCVAYTYVSPDGSITLPTFTTTNAATNTGQIYQFRNARISGAIGNSQSVAQDSGTSVSCGAIVATSDHSLAVVFWTSTQTVSSWPPSGGWVNMDGQSAYLALTNQSDSTGSINFTLNGSTYSRTLAVEILGANAAVADNYFNGLPYFTPPRKPIARQSLNQRLTPI